MTECITNLRINGQGALQYSKDNGCHWVTVGMVQGQDGQDGTNGTDGANGVTPHINMVNKHWVIGSQDTGIVAEGKDGDSPYINQDGYWVVEGIVTQYKAIGDTYDLQAAAGVNIGTVDTNPPTVTASRDDVNRIVTFTFDYLKGAKGDTPALTATQTPTGYDIKVGNDLLCSLTNGQDGQDGEDGADGDTIDVVRDNVNNKVSFYVNNVLKAELFDGIRYSDGDHINIDNDNKINCTLSAGEGIHITENDEIEADVIVPTEKNELIYSDDGTTLTTHQLMFTGGLVVDTPEDLALCQASADVTMSTVYSSWTPYGYDSGDKGKWGYCDSEGSGTTKNVTLADGTTQVVPLYKYNGNPQGYIFNTKNTSYITGYYSSAMYSSYDSVIAAGIIPELKDRINTDYMAVIPALYEGSDMFCGISFSLNNTYNIGREGREEVYENHTISVIAWTQSSPDARVTYPTDATNIQLLTNAEGRLISAYNSSLCNGNSNGTASTIQARIQRRGDVITLCASDPYPTTDDDFTHRNDTHSDCPIVINLAEYKLSYTYKNSSGVLTTVTKDFSDSSNPPTGYTSANVTSIKAIFDKLKTSAKRGYEVCSNPGSIFRNCSSDEIILDVTPGENKVYGFDGSTWQTLNTTPLAMFLNGSRIAWNRITDKLFYNDGASIYRIASPTENSANDGKLTIKGDETTVVEFTANQSTNKTLKVKGSTGVTVSGTDGQITVSTESNHTVVSKTGIITGGSEHGSQAYELGVRCDLSGITVKAVDLEDFATSEYSTPRTFKWTKALGDTGKYVGLFGVSSTDACYVFKVLITNTVTNETESHLYGVIEDTPPDSTFLFVTTNSWPIVCKGFSNSMVAYMQIPDDFVGTIEVVPMRYKVRSGGAVFCFEPTGVSDGTPYDSGWSEDGTEVTLDFYTSSLIYGSDISDLRTPSGRYNVDVIGDFGGSIIVGSKIADSVINDYILHTLSKKVDSLVNSQSLTIGSTTITEAQLQALLATLQ